MNAPDPRIVRTRRAVLDAAREALLAGEGATVTLTDIAARAGYSRRAVHANFVDLAGIFRAVTLDALALGEGYEVAGGDPVDAPLPPDDLRRLTLRVVTQVYDERELLLRVAELSAHRALTDVLSDVVDQILTHGRDRLGLAGLDSLNTAFLTGGCVSVLRAWIRGELQATPETLTDTALRLIALVTGSAAGHETRASMLDAR